jgi:uncharacterized membrane protein
MSTAPDVQIQPPHIEQTVQAIAKLHADHHRRATPVQRVVDQMTEIVANPWFIAVVTLTVVGWIGGNLLLQWDRGWAFDAAPFPWLQGAGQLAAIYITTLVLMSQRRKDELSELREQLILELAIMTEQKSAKLIGLIEELRRDSPAIFDRHDPQAEAMALPTDPAAVMDAFKETHEEMLAANADRSAGDEAER